MLIEFRFKNYRSFRDEAVLSMEAVGLGSFKKSLIEQNNMKLLPGVAIYGKNGGILAWRTIYSECTKNPA